jgi:16S rRNA G1207 methylase RsmC
MMYPDIVIEEENKKGENMLMAAVDDKTEYLHVILVGSNDKGSEAQMKNLVNLIQLQKLNNKQFKLVTIQYMSKNNDELKKQLTTIAACVQKQNEMNEDLGRWIPAKISNIQEKMANVVDWFNKESNSSLN